MNNPTENIVTIWLQEFTSPKHFTMNNVYVHRKKDKKYGIKGGLGPEIDIIATDGKKYYWVEVSVPPRPFGAGGHKGTKVAKDYIKKKFTAEKKRYIARELKLRPVEKWFVYSSKFFNKRANEEKKFQNTMKQKGVRAISFETILSEIYERLNYRGFDETRNYLFLLKQFGYGKGE